MNNFVSACNATFTRMEVLPSATVSHDSLTVPVASALSKSINKSVSIFISWYETLGSSKTAWLSSMTIFNLSIYLSIYLSITSTICFIYQIRLRSFLGLVCQIRLRHWRVKHEGAARVSKGRFPSESCGVHAR